MHEKNNIVMSNHGHNTNQVVRFLPTHFYKRKFLENLYHPVNVRLTVPHVVCVGIILLTINTGFS